MMSNNSVDNDDKRNNNYIDDDGYDATDYWYSTRLSASLLDNKNKDAENDEDDVTVWRM